MALPLRITELAVTGFRNLSSARLVPDLRANVLLGANGQGKTSALEAVDYVASLRSFRGATRAQVVGHEAPFAEVLLRVESSAGLREYRVKVSRTAREITLDGKRPERAVDYFGGASCVVFQPGDLELVRGPPELRRRLLDRVLLRSVEGYGEALKNYSKALRSRNQLLRERSPELRAVQSFDYGLSRYGSALVRARASLARELRVCATRSLAELCLSGDDLGVEYKARGSGDSTEYALGLARSLGADLARRTTLMGPHADDLSLTWGGRPARVVASQGQTRALALALRLAEHRVIEDRTKSTPVLLLDDVSSELDRPRTERLFAMVQSLGAQVFVTTTDPVIAAMVKGAQGFQVNLGKISPIGLGG